MPQSKDQSCIKMYPRMAISQMRRGRKNGFIAVTRYYHDFFIPLIGHWRGEVLRRIRQAKGAHLPRNVHKKGEQHTPPPLRLSSYPCERRNPGKRPLTGTGE